MPTLPSTVTQRAQGNDFIAETGMLLSGISGFGIRTGFYLTNSGNYPIETTITPQPANGNVGASTFPQVFEFPSGKQFSMLAGQTKFIPFDFVAVQDNTVPSWSGPAEWGGPDFSGRYSGTFRLESVSTRNAQVDPSGVINLGVTGQVTGIAGTPGSPGHMPATLPAYPSGFRVTTSYGSNGKPEQALRWYHPETGYFLTQYSVEYAGNISRSSVATGSWTGLHTFEVNYESSSISDSTYYIPVNFRKFATNTGINQRYTRGTNPQYDSNYGEHTVSDLGFNADYYYRIKSQYLIPSTMGTSGVQFESDYVYGYPVSNFKSTVTSADVQQGLLSGSSALPAGASNSPYGVINNSAGSMQALYVYFKDGQSDINLKTEFDAEIARRKIGTTYFDPTNSEYAFTGVHFVLPEGYIVGASSVDAPGIQTGGVIQDASSNEVDVVLNLQRDSTVLGAGGDGGDGGYSDIALETANTLNIHEGKFEIGDRTTVESAVGGSGGPAIKVTSSQSKFKIRKDILANIYGGGGGGGGGDPFFWPKAFTITADGALKYDETYQRTRKKRAVNFEKINEFEYTFDVDPQTKNYNHNTITELKINYTLDDIVGTQLAGVGGGGQGFGTSRGGGNKKQGVGIKGTDHDGGREGAGLGSVADMDIKLSFGGNGGVFGEDGNRAVDADASVLFNVDSSEQPTPQDGGTAGAAIEVVSTNSNYSSFGDLLTFKNIVSPSNIPSLVAWFSTDDSTKFTCTSTGSLSSGKNYITKWTSKNSASIYMDSYSARSWGATNCPLFVTSSTTKQQSTGAALYATDNATSYTQFFNDQEVAFFGHKNNMLEINGIIGSSKLTEDMESFEIMYFLYPGAAEKALSSELSAFAVSGESKGLFVGSNSDRPTNNEKNWNNSKYRGWALHQWSDIGGADDKNDSYVNPSFFYNRKGQTSEGTGLPKNEAPVTFGDFTNKKSPNRAWLYSISATRQSGQIYYTVYNNLNLMAEAFYPGSAFSWLTYPRIGLTRSSGLSSKIWNCFYGGISDLVVFNKALTSNERSAVYAYLANTKLTIASSANRNTATDRNTLDMQNGFAGFNLGAGW